MIYGFHYNKGKLTSPAGFYIYFKFVKRLTAETVLHVITQSCRAALNGNGVTHKLL